MRETLPERRASWTQSVRIEGQRVYLTVGEYPDGRPGEIFLDVAKQGTFTRGMTDALARMASIAMQCGADVGVIVKALKGLNYPPSGKVEGSSVVSECSSVTDWVAQELAARYMEPGDYHRLLAELHEEGDEDNGGNTGDQHSPFGLGS